LKNNNVILDNEIKIIKDALKNKDIIWYLLIQISIKS
jgi:hypothetical protein